MSNTITVEATGKDNYSGIYTYKFMYKIAGTETFREADTITVENEETCNYTYRGLGSGLKYELAVIVADRAGNEVLCDKDAKGQKIEFITKQEIKIGSWVAYEPDNPEEEYNAQSIYTGYDTDQKFGTEELGWRIWDIDEEKITLMAAQATSSQLYLREATGYNNGVYVLNELCKARYSRKDMNAVARSINFTEIVEKLDEEVKSKFLGERYRVLPGIVYQPNDGLTIPTVHFYEDYAIIDGKVNYPGQKFSQREQPRNQVTGEYLLFPWDGVSDIATFGRSKAKSIF